MYRVSINFLFLNHFYAFYIIFHLKNKKTNEKKLYAKIADWAACDREKTVVLDVCCGTGTIGLTLATRATQVIGFELNAEALADAKENALSNGIENAVWHLGPVQETLPRVFKAAGWLKGRNVVAVVDPPRTGLRFFAFLPIFGFLGFWIDFCFVRSL